LAFEELGVKAHTIRPRPKKNRSPRFCVQQSSLLQFHPTASKIWKECRSGGCLRGPPREPNSQIRAHDIYNPCKPGSRFGVTAQQLGDGLPHGVEGLHFHTLFESDSFALERVLAAFLLKFGRFLSHLKWVNMGGGHLITGKGYDIPHLVGILKDFKSKYDVEVILEPGSAFTYQDRLPGVYDTGHR